MKVHAVLTEDLTRPGESGETASTQQVNGAADLPESRLSPERLQEIRARIRSGYYDSEQVIDAVARRLLDAEEIRD